MMVRPSMTLCTADVEAGNNESAASVLACAAKVIVLIHRLSVGPHSFI